MKKIEERFAVHVDDYKSYDTEKLRKHFLIENIFIAELVYVDPGLTVMVWVPFLTRA